MTPRQNLSNLSRVAWPLATALIVAGLSAACEQRSRPAPESARSEAGNTQNVAAKDPAAESVATGTTASNGDVAPTKVAAPAVSQTLTPEARMAYHSREAHELRDAVIAGNHAAALPQARDLSENNWTPHLKPAWREHMQAMYDAASLYTKATTSTEAASAVGKLGLACARCHQSLGGPKLAPTPEAPAPGMAAHAWAVERLWTALISPNDAAWLAGAQELAKNPVVRSDVTGVDEQAKRLQKLGLDAFTTTGDARAEVFGKVLGTCANCHRKTGTNL